MMPFIATTNSLPELPALYVSWRQETAAPFRRCRRAAVVKVPWTGHALVFGVWGARLAGEAEADEAIFRLSPVLEQDMPRVG